MVGVGEAEAISIAGHYKLGRLIAFWDHNSISIYGPTHLAVSDLEIERFRASGWQVQETALLFLEAAQITSEDREALRRAVRSLEYPSLAGRLTSIVGKPVELIGAALPAAASKGIASATSKGLEAALKVALRTLAASTSSGSSILLHRALATASGAAGGTFGLAALPVELPLSTVIMLRSIADIARSEGENLKDPATALACVEVFALGGRAGSTDVSESGYFSTRTVLAKTVSEAARFIAERGLVKEGAPVLLKFVTQVAARFGVFVSQKVAAQALPVVGAIGGAAVAADDGAKYTVTKCGERITN